MKHLYPYLRRFRKESILAPLFKMLEATFDLLVPMVVADIIKVGIAGGDTTYIWTRCGLLVLMALIGLLCSFTAQYFAARAAIGTSTGLRHELMAHIQSLSFSELDTLGVSTLITRMTSDVNQVQNGLNMFLRLFLRSPFIVAGAMIAAFTIDTQIALIFLAAIPVLAVIVFGIMRITSPMYKTVQSRLDAVTGATRENLSGVRVVRAFGREDAEEENFVQQNGSLNAMQLKVGRIAALMNPLTYVVVNLGIIGILYFGANKIGSGALLSGDVVALVNYMSQILVELVKLANLVVLLTRAIARHGPRVAGAGYALDDGIPGEARFGGCCFRCGGGVRPCVPALSGCWCGKSVQCDLHGKEGADHRRYRRHGQRQNDARQPDSALL